MVTEWQMIEPRSDSSDNSRSISGRRSARFGEGNVLRRLLPQPDHGVSADDQAWKLTVQNSRATRDRASHAGFRPGKWEEEVPAG